MATQYTSILKLALPVQGELSGTWGNVINDNITSMVEEAVAGRAVIDSWTTNSHTLTTANGTASESRCAMLQFTDTGVALTGAATVICPSETKLYICKNSTGQQVTVKTAAGTGVALVDGVTKFVFCDGTNVEECVTSIETLKTDTINEATAAAGVTVDGVLLKDGGAVFADGATIEVDTINEATAAAGVTADGVLLKDGGITATAASSFSDSSGVALTVTGSGQELGLVSQASDTATVGPFFDIDRDSATPAVDDHIGSVGFTGRNSTAGTVRYSDVRGWIVDPTSTTESGGLRFLTYDAGTYATRAVVMGSDFGIGTTSPTAKLHVTNTGSGDSLLVEDSASPDSTPFVITSNGTVGLGTTAPSISNGVGPIIVSEASAAYGPQSSWRNTTSDATAGYFHFEKSRSGGLVSASDEVGTLSWRAHDGVDFRGVAGIGALMGATPAAGDTPGILYFKTTAEGATSSTERMRIDSAGRVGIGTSAPEGKLHVHSGTAGTTAPSNDADELVLENNGRCGVSLLAPNAENTNLYFGSPSNNGGAFLRWNHDANLLRVSTAQTGAEVAFSAGASNEAMRIDSSSNVGIGTSAPDGKLHVHTGSAGTVTANSEADDLVVENNGNAGISILAPDANYSNFYMGSPTDNIGAYLRWRYSDLEAKLSTSAVGGELVLGSDNGAEAMRIDSSGNVLVGHTDALTVAGSVNRFQVLGTNAPTSQAVLGRFSNDTSSPEFIFLKSRSGTIGSNTIVQDGDDVGTIGFNVDDGVDYQSRIAAIRGELDGSGLAENDVPGRLTFFTTADGAAASTERMRIDSAGRVAIGTTAPEGKLHIYSAASGATTANADADELVLDSNGSCGISLRAPDAENTNIYFASPTDSAGAYIRWNYDASVLRVATDKAGAELALYTGANAERVRIDSAGGVGIGTSNPSAKLHVQDTSSTVLQLDTTGAAGTDMTRLTQFPGQSKLIDIKGTGSSLLELIADPDDGTSTAYVRVNRDTSTTGSSGLQVLRGNGTATSSHILYGLNTGTGADDALLCLNGGSLGVGSSNPTEKLDVNGDAIRVRTSQTPASASATGDAGMICWDANYVYVCTAANTWKRAALATW